MKCNNIFDLHEYYIMNIEHKIINKVGDFFFVHMNYIKCLLHLNWTQYANHGFIDFTLCELRAAFFHLFLCYSINLIACTRWISYLPLHTYVSYILVTESRGMDGGYDSSIHLTFFGFFGIFDFSEFNWIEIKSIFSNIMDLMPLKLQIQDLTRLLLPLNENRKTVLHCSRTSYSVKFINVFENDVR